MSDNTSLLDWLLLKEKIEEIEDRKTKECLEIIFKWLDETSEGLNDIIKRLNKKEAK